MATLGADIDCRRAGLQAVARADAGGEEDKVKAATRGQAGGGMVAPDGPGALEEIAARVAAMRESSEAILPPLFLLGVMERVGSNWMSDTLRPVTGQHNEPFRQQLSPAHPLSALNPGLSLGDPSGDLGAYGRHSLVTFAVGKHAPVRQVIKETNLFFALPALLALFPHSPAAVLTRSPLGVASSFARGGLFRRWGNRARYRQLAAMAMRPEFAAFAGVVPDDDAAELTALTRLCSSLACCTPAVTWAGSRSSGTRWLSLTRPTRSRPWRGWCRRQPASRSCTADPQMRLRGPMRRSRPLPARAS
jgi:hypothetical protein